MLLTSETEAALSGLADLKRSLLRSFAVGLRKCADLMLYLAEPHGPRSSKPIAPVTPAREEVLPDGGPADTNGAGPGPPAHWAELFKSGPPAHWVELVRQSAPELLTEADDGPVYSTAEGVASSPAEETPQPESTSVKAESAPPPEERSLSRRPKPMPLLARRATNKRPRESSPTSKSLIRPMRLRVEPAKPQGDTAARRSALDSKREPEHISTDNADATIVGQDVPLPAPERSRPDNTAEGASLMTMQAESMGQSRGSRQPPPALYKGGGVRPAGAAYPGRPQARPEPDGKARREGDDYMDASSAKTHAPREPHVAGGDTERREISAPGTVERVAPPAFMARVEAPHSTQTVFDEEKSFRARGDRRRTPEEVKGRAGSTDIAPMRGAKRADQLSPSARARDFSIPGPAHGAVASHHGQAADAPALMDEKTPNEAAPMHQSARALGQSSENPWPDLPVAPPSEPMDEAAALEGELRRVQRLEREQRGMWWNA